MMCLGLAAIVGVGVVVESPEGCRVCVGQLSALYKLSSSVWMLGGVQSRGSRKTGPVCNQVSSTSQSVSSLDLLLSVGSD